MSDCCKPTEEVKVETTCCGPSDNAQQSEVDSCCEPKSGIDWLFWGSSSALIASLAIVYFAPSLPKSLVWVQVFAEAESKLLKEMWLGMLIGVLSIGLMNLLPKQAISSAFGQQRGIRSILRAAAAGIVLDLCNHGLLLIAAKLYKSGVRYSQVLAFLIASPWNSLSLTIVMFALLGWQWTLAFIILSFIVAVITGLIVEKMEDNGSLAVNPYTAEVQAEEPISLKENVARIKQERGILKTIFIDSFAESKMIMRWLLFGMVLAALIQTFVSGEIMQTWFGPTLLGLGMTLIAATVIEVCSEGLLPIAADLMSRAAAPGNAFTFMMAGVSTDYTEIMVLKETTGKWKTALLLPLISVPQILIIGAMLNL